MCHSISYPTGQLVLHFYFYIPRQVDKGMELDCMIRWVFRLSTQATKKSNVE